LPLIKQQTWAKSRCSRVASLRRVIGATININATSAERRDLAAAYVEDPAKRFLLQCDAVCSVGVDFRIEAAIKN